MQAAEAQNLISSLATPGLLGIIGLLFSVFLWNFNRMVRQWDNSIERASKDAQEGISLAEQALSKTERMEDKHGQIIGMLGEIKETTKAAAKSNEEAHGNLAFSVNNLQDRVTALEVAQRTRESVAREQAQ